MKLIIGMYEDIKNEIEPTSLNDFFEFYFPYVERTERFREIDRFLYESKSTKRYLNEYSGKILLNITEWSNNEYINNYFIAFMMFIKDNQDKYECVLISEKDCKENIISVLNDLFTIERHYIGKLKDEKQIKIGFESDKDRSRRDKEDVRG